MALLASPGDRVNLQSPSPLSSDVNRLITKLSKSRHFAQLHSLLKAICASETLEGGAQDMKENFKLILLGLGKSYTVDEVWGGVEAATHEKEAQRLGEYVAVKRTQSPARSLKSSSKERLSRTATQRTVSPVANSHLSLHARSDEELYSMVTSSQSDFTHVVGAATFNRAAKPSAQTVLSPGPSDYNYDFQQTHRKSPSPVIPRGGKRLDYIPETPSPGPGTYYPIRRFVSK